MYKISVPVMNAHAIRSGRERLVEELGEYGETFLRVLQDAAEENENLRLSICAEKRT